MRLLSVFLIIVYSATALSTPKKQDRECLNKFALKSRFQSLYRMLKTSDKLSSSDTLLYSDKDFVIIPTLGSVTPLYILFITKNLFYNFAQASSSYKHKTIPLIADILSENFNYSGNFIWFEHGATTSGIVPESKVDHGHIHVILDPKFTFDSFREKAMSMDKRAWEPVATVNAYDNRNGQQDYLSFGNKDRAFWAYLETPKIPQFFRRVVADLVGRSSEWNYREFPHHNIAATTVSFMQQRLKERYKQSFIPGLSRNKILIGLKENFPSCREELRVAFLPLLHPSLIY